MAASQATALKTARGSYPKQGNRELFYQFDFSTAASITKYSFDDQTSGRIDDVQSCYIDNSLNGSAVTFTFNDIFNIVAQPNTQGVYPVLSSGRLKIVGASAGGVVVSLILSNVPTDYFVWGPINATAQFATPQGVFVDRSGNIAAGGTSQQLAAANGARKRIFVENPATATGQNIAAAESLFIRFTGAAGVNNGTSIEILPGGWFDSGSGPVSTQAITVNAATIGHVYIAEEM